MSGPHESARPKKRPNVRVVLYSGPSTYTLATIHSEYCIEHVEDEKNQAFEWSSSNVWYAVALEVDGQRAKFLSSEQVVLKVIDERDPHAGATVVGSRNSVKPFSDGMHYFSALEFRKVGEFRVIIAMVPGRTRREWRESGVRPRPLIVDVRVEDPDYEAAQRARITAALPGEIERVRKSFAKLNEYPSAPLTHREK